MKDVFYLQAHISGHVQGVGFRYSTLNVARNHPVSGIVKNLPDGRVFLDVESDTENDAVKFLDDLADYMASYIKSIESTKGKRQSQFKGFKIIY